MAQSLQGAKVLVTRPAGQGEALTSLITECGGRALHYPVMDIVPVDRGHQQLKTDFLNLDLFQHVIFVSTNAVDHGMRWIEQYWPQMPVGIHWYGMGAATAQALLRAGISDTALAAGLHTMNSEELLQLPTLQAMDKQRVLIVRGIGGREYLREQLQRRGAQVSYAQCYSRQTCDRPEGELWSALKENGIDHICCNSTETLDSLIELVEQGANGQAQLQQLKEMTVIVPGSRVVDYAVDLGFATVIEAKNASDTAILNALIDI